MTGEPTAESSAASGPTGSSSAISPPTTSKPLLRRRGFIAVAALLSLAIIVPASKGSEALFGLASILVMLVAAINVFYPIKRLGFVSRRYAAGIVGLGLVMLIAATTKERLRVDRLKRDVPAAYAAEVRDDAERQAQSAREREATTERNEEAKRVREARDREDQAAKETHGESEVIVDESTSAQAQPEAVTASSEDPPTGTFKGMAGRSVLDLLMGLHKEGWDVSKFVGFAFTGERNFLFEVESVVEGYIVYRLRDSNSPYRFAITKVQGRFYADGQVLPNETYILTGVQEFTTVEGATEQLLTLRLLTPQDRPPAPVKEVAEQPEVEDGTASTAADLGEAARTVAGLGVSRAQAVSFYEKRGFAFHDGSPLAGVPMVVGEKNPAHVQIVGHPENVVSIQITSDMGRDVSWETRNVQLADGNAFIDLVARDWRGAGEWLTEVGNRGAGSFHTTFRNLRFEHKSAAPGGSQEVREGVSSSAWRDLLTQGVQPTATTGERRGSAVVQGESAGAQVETRLQAQGFRGFSGGSVEDLVFGVRTQRVDLSKLVGKAYLGVITFAVESTVGDFVIYKRVASPGVSAEYRLAVSKQLGHYYGSGQAMPNLLSTRRNEYFVLTGAQEFKSVLGATQQVLTFRVASDDERNVIEAKSQQAAANDEAARLDATSRSLSEYDSSLNGQQTSGVTGRTCSGLGWSHEDCTRIASRDLDRLAKWDTLKWPPPPRRLLQIDEQEPKCPEDGTMSKLCSLKKLSDLLREPWDEQSRALQAEVGRVMAETIQRAKEDDQRRRSRLPAGR